MVRIDLPAVKLPSVKLPGLPGGSSVKPLTSKAPSLPTTKAPSTRPETDINPPTTKASPDNPEAPTLKPDEADVPTDLNPKPSTGSVAGKVGTALGLGGLVAGGTMLSQQFTSVASAGAAVGQTAVLAEAGKEVVDSVLNFVGGGFDTLTQNPINLAIVAGVIALVLLR